MSGFIPFRKVPHGDEWFDVYEITPYLFAIHEPGHYEETIASLLIGRERAALIDTGCGIGDLRRAVRAVTDMPVVVINTHTHLDHVGGNCQFDDIAMFDHPRSRALAGTGIAAQARHAEILAGHLVRRPWPASFDPGDGALPPFNDGWSKAIELTSAAGDSRFCIHQARRPTTSAYSTERTASCSAGTSFSKAQSGLTSRAATCPTWSEVTAS